MAGQQKLVSLWVGLLLMATLCPGAQYVHSKRGGVFRGRGKGDGSKVPSSQSQGFSKQAAKWVGAAAGVLGGTGTGYGLGFLGRAKHGSGNRYSHKTASQQDQQLNYNQGQGYHNESVWRAFPNTANATSRVNLLITFRHVVSFLVAICIRNM